MLFLPINKDKPHHNMSNSMGAMIFCFIKLSEIYHRKYLKQSQYFFIVNFEDFIAAKTSKNLWEMKDEIKSNKTLYFLNKNLEVYLV